MDSNNKPKNSSSITTNEFLLFLILEISGQYTNSSSSKDKYKIPEKDDLSLSSTDIDSGECFLILPSNLESQLFSL